MGFAAVAMARGAHAHTHNLSGKRWSGESQIVDHRKEQS